MNTEECGAAAGIIQPQRAARLRSDGAVKLLASGRDADVFEVDDDRVLRRYRDPARSAAGEAEVMRHALRCGLPVPLVHDADGPDLVLERLHGPTMAQLVMRRPWLARREARRLAALHAQVHAVDAPAALRSAGRGASLLHLDFHPENVVITAGGCRVIDWTNAAAGPAAVDVADTWLVMSAAVLSGSRLRQAVGERLARAFADVFVEAAGVDYLDQLDVAAERRLMDKNLNQTERDRITRLVAARR